jgi:hypothetical protein
VASTSDVGPGIWKMEFGPYNVAATIVAYRATIVHRTPGQRRGRATIPWGGAALDEKVATSPAASLIGEPRPTGHTKDTRC